VKKKLVATKRTCSHDELDLRITAALSKRVYLVCPETISSTITQLHRLLCMHMLNVKNPNPNLNRIDGRAVEEGPGESREWEVGLQTAGVVGAQKVAEEELSRPLRLETAR
jgi:hypothetical protein